MRSAPLLLFVSLLIAPPISKPTLQDLLASYNVPLALFSHQELAATVQGMGSREPTRTVIAYQPTGANQMLGRLALLAYRKTDNSIVRTTAALLLEDDICNGAVDGLTFLDGFTLLSTSLNPSANCVLVFDGALHRRTTLYGFNVVEVSPGFVVVAEDMIHFAPVHPERLQLAALATGKTRELYPPKGDVLRGCFAADQARHMPPAETCRRMNDPCQPEIFDEDISDLVSDGKGSFAFLAHQSASHALAENTPPEDFGSQTVLYVYQGHSGRGAWKYCETKAQPTELAEQGGSDHRFSLPEALARCSPTRPVLPDVSTASYNPFFRGDSAR